MQLEVTGRVGRSTEHPGRIAQQAGPAPRQTIQRVKRARLAQRSQVFVKNTPGCVVHVESTLARP